ncbi:GtrA family protein [Saccharicrinis sp. FJH62]|uniref:GtrA family protein n=1 Tax=Saccharicrinis sp. FJH62 TaxID=3344657 RepID=UPI0035D3EF02
MIFEKVISKILTARQEIFRFVVVGIIATILHYGIYYILLQLHIKTNLAYSTGYFLSFIVNYFLTVSYTFKTKSSIKKGLGFGISHLINYLLHILFLNFYIYIGFKNTLAPIPVYATVVPINFLLIRTVMNSK